jgi:hypothetical protein
MYLVLRPPWGGEGTASAPGDAGPIATAPVDAGAQKPKRRPKQRRPGTPAQPGDDIVDEGPVTIELSAADRALEWRGDDVTLPAQRIDMGAGGEARSLEDGEINSTVGNQSAGVRACVVQAATGTDLRATITIKLVVDGNGRVTKTKLQAPRHLFNQGLYACANRSLRGMRFPSTGAPTLVTFPVNLG